MIKASTDKQHIADLHATLDHLERGWNRTRRMPEGDGLDCWKLGVHPSAATNRCPRANRNGRTPAERPTSTGLVFRIHKMAVWRGPR